MLDGKLTGHVDFHSDWVVLYSIGLTCKFYVRIKGKGRKTFNFQSGDVLVFDASRKADIYHGIKCVVKDTCPQQLMDKYQILSQSRVSIQFRVFGKLEPSKNIIKNDCDKDKEKEKEKR